MTSRKCRCVFTVIAALLSICGARSLGAGEAATPPMGWNSYDSYGAMITEEQFKANVDFLAAHLKQHGYEYACLDYCWSYPFRASGRTGSEALNQKFNADENTFEPSLAMDRYGRLIPHRSRFPSAYDDQGAFVGLNSLVNYVHSKGLKFGLHIMRGIPRQAYAANTPVLDSAVTATQIADTKSTTAWLNHMYGLQTTDGLPTGKLTDGSQAYYNALIKMYAAWGVDFIKADDMLRDFSKPGRSYYAGEITGLRDAIDRCGRPMVLSLSPGAAPLGHADELSHDANMWRMLDDMWDNWRDIDLVFDMARKWTPFRQAGHWPDADMLPLGTFVRPPVGRPRKSSLTSDEQRTVMTLWSIVRSPLIYGGDLPSLSDDQTALMLITNDAVLKVNQHSEHNRQISIRHNDAVWAAGREHSKNVYVALFNRSNEKRSVSVALADLELSEPSYSAIDLWNSTGPEHIEGSLQQTLEPHASALYEIVVDPAPAP